MQLRSFAAAFIAAVVALLALKDANSAEQTARDAVGNTATITDKPCTDPTIMQYVPPQHRDGMKAGSAVVDGKKYAMCWKDMGPGVAIVFPDGDMGRIGWNEFSKRNKRGT